MTTTLQELDEVLVNGDVFDRARFLVAYAAEIRAALELKARVDAGDVIVPREQLFRRKGEIEQLTAERDALRGALEQIERMEINGVSNIAKWALEESRTAVAKDTDQ
jgi:hypothetical protein